MRKDPCATDSDIVRFLTGRTDDALRDRLQAHLASCESCIAIVAAAARGSISATASWPLRLRPPLLSPGTVVAGRYHLRRSLGQGGMGEVHQADDQLLGTVVALKTLNASLIGQAGAVDRLKSEVALARRVTHPNVCRIFDLGIDQDFPGGPTESLFFLTMEYLPGPTLAAYLAQRGPLATSEALPVLRQIADGLAAAHAVGVIHRDLKGENVMLVEEPGKALRAVITDFGLAGPTPADTSVPTHARAFSGTLAFAAPERLAGQGASAASDVYSFGVLAKVLLIAPASILGARAASLPPLDPWLDASWVSFFRRALHPDPQRRYADGGELVAALRDLSSCAAGSPAVTAGAASGVAKDSARPTVRAGGIGAAGVAAMAATVSLVLALTLGNRARPPMAAGPLNGAPVAASAAVSARTNPVTAVGAPPGWLPSPDPQGKPTPRSARGLRAPRAGKSASRAGWRQAPSPMQAQVPAPISVTTSAALAPSRLPVGALDDEDAIVRDFPLSRRSSDGAGDLVNPFIDGRYRDNQHSAAGATERK